MKNLRQNLCDALQVLRYGMPEPFKVPDPELVSLEVQNGEWDLKFKHEIIPLLAMNCARLFETEGGPNHVTMTLTDPQTFQSYDMTIEKTNGKTKGQLLQEARSQLRLLELENVPAPESRISYSKMHTALRRLCEVVCAIRVVESTSARPNFGPLMGQEVKQAHEQGIAALQHLQNLPPKRGQFPIPPPSDDAKSFQVLLLNVLEPREDDICRHMTCSAAGWNHAGEFVMHNFVEWKNGLPTDDVRDVRDVGPWFEPYLILKKHVSLGDDAPLADFELVPAGQCFNQHRQRIDARSIWAQGYEIIPPLSVEQQEEIRAYLDDLKAVDDELATDNAR